MKKRVIILSDPLDTWLRVASEADGISVSELIRRVLDKMRKREESAGR